MALKKRILVIDDSAIIRELLKDVLAPDYEILEASDGLRGWLIATMPPYPDLVIADVEMPKLNGIALFKRLRLQEATRAIPCVLLTSRDRQVDVKHATSIGVRFYLTKPFHPEDVKLKVDRLLAE